MARYSNKLILPVGPMNDLVKYLPDLHNYELVYSEDTKQLAIKLPGNNLFLIGEADKIRWEDILNKPDLPTIEETETMILENLVLYDTQIKLFINTLDRENVKLTGNQLIKDQKVFTNLQAFGGIGIPANEAGLQPITIFRQAGRLHISTASNKPGEIAVMSDIANLDTEIKQHLRSNYWDKTETEQHLRSNYYNNTEVDDKDEAVLSHVRSNYYNKIEVDAKDTALRAHIRSNYFDKDEIEDKLKTMTIDGGNLNG